MYWFQPLWFRVRWDLVIFPSGLPLGLWQAKKSSRCITKLLEAIISTMSLDSFSFSFSFAGALVFNPSIWHFRSAFFDTDIMFLPSQEVSSADPDKSKPVWADPPNSQDNFLQPQNRWGWCIFAIDIVWPSSRVPYIVKSLSTVRSQGSLWKFCGVRFLTIASLIIIPYT